MSYIHNIVYKVSQYSSGGTPYYTGGPRQILDHELYLFYLRGEYTDRDRVIYSAMHTIQGTMHARHTTITGTKGCMLLAANTVYNYGYINIGVCICRCVHLYVCISSLTS